MAMLGGTALFSAFHFPLNAVLFKELSVKIQKKLAAYQLLVISFFIVGIYYFFVSKSVDFILLLIVIYTSLFIIIGIKYFLIFNEKN